MRARGIKAPILRLSSTLSFGNRRRFSGPWAIPRSTMRWAGTPRSDRPSRLMPPPKVGMSPDTTRISVVLPAPLGPITPTVSPAATSSDTPNNVRKEPYPAEISTSDSMIGLSPLAEINFRHARIARGLAGQPVENLLAVVEHDDALDDAHQHAHDVLDPHDCDPHATADAREQVGGAFHLGGIEPAHGFVGQKQLRPRGESARQFQLLERRSTEPLRGGRAAGKAD